MVTAVVAVLITGSPSRARTATLVTGVVRSWRGSYSSRLARDVAGAVS